MLTNPSVPTNMVVIKVGFLTMSTAALLFVTGVLPESPANYVIVTVIGFLTMFVQQWFASSRDKRNRQYDLEDRRTHAEEARKALLASAELLAEQNKADALTLQMQVARNLDETRRQVAVTSNEAAQSRQNITTLLQENTAVTKEIEATVKANGTGKS